MGQAQEGRIHTITGKCWYSLSNRQQLSRTSVLIVRAKLSSAINNTLHHQCPELVLDINLINLILII